MRDPNDYDQGYLATHLLEDHEAPSKRRKSSPFTSKSKKDKRDRLKDSYSSDSDDAYRSIIKAEQPVAQVESQVAAPAKRKSCSDWFCSCLKRKPDTRHRRITLGTRLVDPPNKVANTIKNQKYNLITFLPVVFYNQFKFFFNLFFLVTALSQLYPPLVVGYWFTYFGPLGLTLTLTMTKEAIDDYYRYKKDKEANNELYKLMTPEGFKDTPSSQLRVGDIIEIQGGQRIPADCLVLQTSDLSGSIFLKTDQLDGETDWKVRKAVRFTHAYYNEHQTLLTIEGATVTAKPPIVNIYEFEGLFEAPKTDSDSGEKVVEPLGLENTMWASTVLTAGSVIALVLYTGYELRIVMNSRSPRTKVGRLDQEVNFLSKLLFAILFGFSVMLVALGGFSHDVASVCINVTRFVLLLSTIIPISLRVNLDFAKLAYSYQMATDKEIPGTKVNNSVIPEEIGRIQYLLSDKTGTLTQNDMIFKRLSLEFGTYTHEMTGELANILKKQCHKYDGPLGDSDPKIKKIAVEAPSLGSIPDSMSPKADILSPKADMLSPKNNSPMMRSSLAVGRPSTKRIKREKEAIVRDMITAMVLCHNVTPVIEDGHKIYQGSSPDEIALVQIAESLGMILEQRDEQMIRITNAAGKEERYRILANFPFSSVTKRMGIILEHEATSRIIFYLKGADVVMKDKVPEKQRGFLLDECENLAREGLRTLVLSQRNISTEEFTNWKKIYDEATMSLVDRDDKTRKAIELIEKDMDLLGVTGVEDKLQEEVCQTLETLRNAGIQVWMLTGDKIETAMCISISAGIKSSSQTFHVIKEINDPLVLSHKLNEFSNKNNAVLVIDGTTLTHALQSCEENFFKTSTKAPAVVCCRCSPTQKAQITEGIKKYTKMITCCIGDGGNDVGMIQAADVGIGIEGKEGKQAALAADYSITKFKYLKNLLLWHGRLSYKRSAMLSQFVIHRGLIISVIQILFSCLFYFVSIPVYSGILMLGYATIYTMFPVFAMIFDEDIDLERALVYPPLYKTLQKGREMNQKTFYSWVWQSVYQAACIMVFAVTYFNDSFLQIDTITFTALIIAEFLNIFTEVNKWTKALKISTVLSLVSYLGTCFILPSYINVSSFTWDFLWKIALLTLLSWAPIFFFKKIKEIVDPTDHQRIMKAVKMMQRERGVPKRSWIVRKLSGEAEPIEPRQPIMSD